jgi:hypothetical protein
VTRIVITEYPKSGGVWLVNLVGDSLYLPKRDIYINDDYNAFVVSKHPWYKGFESHALTKSCVIKSHELPGSPLHNFPARFIHLLRDGRDVVVSKYFYEKDFCVQNGIYKDFNMSFDECVKKTALEWSAFVSSWLKRDVITCRYEELLEDALSTLKKIFGLLGTTVSDEKICESIKANTKEKMKKSLAGAFQYNTFVRKGIIGDWRNHFTERSRKIFKLFAGDILIRLEYEKDMDW